MNTHFAGPGFTKRLRQKIVITLKRKVLTVQGFFMKLSLFCFDKMGFTKGLRQKFVLDFVITLRPLQGRLKLFFKYSIACIYILPFVMPTKYMLWGSILRIKVIWINLGVGVNRYTGVNWSTTTSTAQPVNFVTQ